VIDDLRSPPSLAGVNADHSEHAMIGSGASLACSHRRPSWSISSIARLGPTSRRIRIRRARRRLPPLLDQIDHRPRGLDLFARMNSVWSPVIASKISRSYASGASLWKRRLVEHVQRDRLVMLTPPVPPGLCRSSPTDPSSGCTRMIKSFG